MSASPAQASRRPASLASSRHGRSELGQRLGRQPRTPLRDRGTQVLLVLWHLAKRNLNTNEKQVRNDPTIRGAAVSGERGMPSVPNCHVTKSGNRPMRSALNTEGGDY
jgi:hypothetical protein